MTHTISKEELERLNSLAFRPAIKLEDGTYLIDLLGQPEELSRYPQETEHIRTFVVQ